MCGSGCRPRQLWRNYRPSQCADKKKQDLRTHRAPRRIRQLPRYDPAHGAAALQCLTSSVHLAVHHPSGHGYWTVPEHTQTREIRWNCDSASAPALPERYRPHEVQVIRSKRLMKTRIAGRSVNRKAGKIATHYSFAPSNTKFVKCFKLQQQSQALIIQ